MIITMLSEIDYAGSGYKIWEAVRKYTDHDTELFSGPHQNKLGHPIRTLVTEANRKQIQDRINNSHVVHIKGDWPARDGYLGLNIMHRPTIQTVCGSFFRKPGLPEHGHEGLGKFTMSAYKANLKTAFTCDLLYPDYSDIWTPHPINSDVQFPIWKKPTGKPIFVHMPTHRARKHTEFILEVFKKLSGKFSFDLRLIEKKTFPQAVELKKQATIYFDQFRVGFYGNSAIEAMQFGIPTACFISDKAIVQAKGQLDECPVINASKNIDAWVDKIVEIMDSDLTELSFGSKKWCDDHHGYKAIAKQWDILYRQLALCK